MAAQARCPHPVKFIGAVISSHQTSPKSPPSSVANVTSRIGARVAGIASPTAVSPWPESPRNDWAMALPTTTPAMLARKLPAIMPPTPVPRPPMPPRVRSIVPGRRTSARVAKRASECGSSLSETPAALRSASGMSADNCCKKHAALLWRELRKRLGVRLLDGFRRRGLQHVAIAGDGLFIRGLRRTCPGQSALASAAVLRRAQIVCRGFPRLLPQ